VGNAVPLHSILGATTTRMSISAQRVHSISKRGDRYLRMLLTRGACSVLRAAAGSRVCILPLYR